MTSATGVYYDPFDFDIDDDPYPIWRRLRDEAPLYHNDKYNFYALSRYEDVSRELMNFDVFRSGRACGCPSRSVRTPLAGIQGPGCRTPAPR